MNKIKTGLATLLIGATTLVSCERKEFEKSDFNQDSVRVYLPLLGEYRLTNLPGDEDDGETDVDLMKTISDSLPNEWFISKDFSSNPRYSNLRVMTPQIEEEAKKVKESIQDLGYMMYKSKQD